MKSKLVIGILVAMVLLCQGIAFAETVSDVKAVAADTATTTDSSVNSVSKVAPVAVNDLVVPVTEPVKAVAAEAKQEEKKEVM